MTGRKSKFGSWSFWLFPLIITLLLLIRDVGLVDVHQLVILSVIGIACLYYRYQELLLFSAFVIPLLCGINGFAASIIFLFIVAKGGFSSTWQLFPVIILATIEVIHVVVGENYPITLSLLYISFIALFFYSIFEERIGVVINEYTHMLCVGCALALFLIGAKLMIEFGSLSAIITESARTAVSMGELENAEIETTMSLNANSVGYFSVLAIALLLQGRVRLGMPVLEYVAVFAIVFLVGACSLGRTWIIVLALTFLLYFVFSSKANRKRYSIILLILLIVVSLTSVALLDVFNVGFEERFSEESVETGGSRTLLFKAYNELWMHDRNLIVFGSGVGYRHQFTQLNAIHNFPQQVYFCTGIIGLAVFLVAFCVLIKRSKSIRKAIPFITAIIYLQSISSLETFVLLLPAIPCFRIAVTNDDKHEVV